MSAAANRGDFNGRPNAGYGMDDDSDGAAAMESEIYKDPPSTVKESANLVEEKPGGCWKKFTHGLRAFWATRHTEDTKENRELYIKTTLRELIVYIIFLVVLMILAFGMTSGTMYYYTKVMSDLFLEGDEPNDVGFKNVRNMHDFWDFLNNKFLDGLYWDTWYNRLNVSEKEKNFIYYENKLLGVPRMRQIRVRNDSCEIASSFRKTIYECYASYSGGAEDYKSFGLKNTTEWKYSTPAQTGSQTYNGELGSYGAGGFVADLGQTRAVSAAMIEVLWKNLWITRGTRVVFIDFTVYNANINLFCVMKLILEFPATGGAIPASDIRTVKLLRYVSPMDYFVLACECIFILFTFYYVVEEVIEIKKNKWSYFKSFWNWLDIFVVGISLVCAGFNIYRTVTVNNKLTSLLEEANSYPDFDFLSYWQRHFNDAVAITVFFAWVKIFKYISFNKTMTQLSSTLGRCARDLFGFSIMFFIIFFAFAQLGYLIFGTQISDFREFQHAVFTLFRIILGDFDFHQLEKAHRVLGPIFFILYVFFVFFVLINMFLAIINDTYTEVKSELATTKNEFEMADYFKQRANMMIDKLHLKRDRILDIQHAIQAADSNNDRVLDFDEWRNELKTRGYADGEIEAVFARYDLDGDRLLDQSEQKRMQNELEGQKAALSEEIQREQPVTKSARRLRKAGSVRDRNASLDSEDEGVDVRSGGVSREDFEAVCRRVDRVESSVGCIVAKIDAVLVKLEDMERAKLENRTTMSKILESLTGEEQPDEEARRVHMEHLVRSELDRWGVAEDRTTLRSSGSDVSRPKSKGGSRPSTGVRVYPD